VGDLSPTAQPQKIFLKFYFKIKSPNLWEEVSVKLNFCVGATKTWEFW